MTKVAHHIVPGSSGGWDVKRDGSQRVSVHTETKTEAIKVGRVMSERMNSEFIVHGADGRIQRSCNCRNDLPFIEELKRR